MLNGVEQFDEELLHFLACCWDCFKYSLLAWQLHGNSLRVGWVVENFVCLVVARIDRSSVDYALLWVSKH